MVIFGKRLQNIFPDNVKDDVVKTTGKQYGGRKLINILTHKVIEIVVQ